MHTFKERLSKIGTIVTIFQFKTCFLQETKSLTKGNQDNPQFFIALQRSQVKSLRKENLPGVLRIFLREENHSGYLKRSFKASDSTRIFSPLPGSTCVTTAAVFLVGV